MVKEVVKLTPRILKLPKIKKIRVAAYARVSTKKDEQHNSLEAQKAYFTKYIKERNDWQFAGLYYDDGISGLSHKNRDGFNRLIEDSLQGKIDLIVTKSVSRFARNTVDSLSTIRKLKEHGTEVYFEKENISTALYLISIPNIGLFFWISCYILYFLHIS
jgi:resolvase, N-terminal domain protein